GIPRDLWTELGDDRARCLAERDDKEAHQNHHQWGTPHASLVRFDTEQRGGASPGQGYLTGVHPVNCRDSLGSMAEARDGNALEPGEAPGEWAVAAPRGPHLPIDDHAGDTGNVAAGHRLEGVARLGGGGRVADDEVGGAADGERARPRGQ